MNFDELFLKAMISWFKTFTGILKSIWRGDLLFYEYIESPYLPNLDCKL